MPNETNAIVSHTPGPWRQYGDGTGICGDKYGTYVALVAKESAAWEANARLIAAAPELLTALKAFRAFYSNSSILPDDERVIVLAADAAIAKAEGRSDDR